MKTAIKSIPFIGNFIVKIYRKIRGTSEFTTSKKYWDDRYKSGGNSGAGSHNNLAEFKAEIINEFLDSKKIESVIEFGCGDGNQLKYFSPKKYFGYDVSKKAIQLCTKLYESDPTKKFYLMKSHNNETAELTMSLDVIYHLIEDQVFSDYMNKLFDASTKFVIIYSSNTDARDLNTAHVKQRKFTDWVEQNKTAFKLIEHIPNKYPFDGNAQRTSIADFFIYEKRE